MAFLSRCVVFSLFKMNSRSPYDSILEAVLTVSPNRQYLGILRPTTAAQHGPVWTPTRSWRQSWGRWRIWNVLTASSSFSDILAISTGCRSSLRTGRPGKYLVKKYLIRKSNVEWGLSERLVKGWNVNTVRVESLKSGFVIIKLIYLVLTEWRGY